MGARKELFRLTEAWNAMAGKAGLSTVKSPDGWSANSNRRKSALARLAEPVFSSSYREALEKIPASDFLLGRNDRGWNATFDWFVRPDSVVKILEGAYITKEVFVDDVSYS